MLDFIDLTKFPSIILFCAVSLVIGLVIGRLFFGKIISHKRIINILIFIFAVTGIFLIFTGFFN